MRPHPEDRLFAATFGGGRKRHLLIEGETWSLCGEPMMGASVIHGGDLEALRREDPERMCGLCWKKRVPR